MRLDKPQAELHLYLFELYWRGPGREEEDASKRSILQSCFDKKESRKKSTVTNVLDDDDYNSD